MTVNRPEDGKKTSNRLVGDQQLVELAKAFVEAFQAALVKSEEVFHTLLTGSDRGFSSGANGTVEFTEQLMEASRKLSSRAMQVFGSTRIHQKSVEEVARSIAFSSSETDSVKQIAQLIAAGISEAAGTQYRIIYPNPLFRFIDDVDEVRVGPVRIARRESIRHDVESRSSNMRVCPLEKERNAFSLID